MLVISENDDLFFRRLLLGSSKRPGWMEASRTRRRTCSRKLKQSDGTSVLRIPSCPGRNGVDLIETSSWLGVLRGNRYDEPV